MWLIIPVILGIYVSVRLVGAISQGSFLSYVDWFQKRFNISNSVAGEALQALGTSAPEIAINVYATYVFLENPAIGIATIIGSAVFQLTLVLAVPFWFGKGTVFDWKPVVRSALFYGFSVLLLVWAAADGVFYAWELGILFFTYLGYLAWLFINDHDPQGDTESHPSTPSLLPDWSRPVQRLSEWIDYCIPSAPSHPVFFLVSLVLIGAFSGVTVELVEQGGSIIGVSSTVLALTVLAAGSSVPELYSNVAKAKEGALNQVIGNALGSNSFDILVSFAGASLIAAYLRGGLVMPPNSNMFGASTILLWALCVVVGVLWMGRWRATRRSAIGLIGVYVAAISSYLFFL